MQTYTNVSFVFEVAGTKFSSLGKPVSVWQITKDRGY